MFHINASEAQDDNGRCLTPEHALRIDPNDFIRAPARVDRKEDGNGAPHDMGVAVAEILQVRLCARAAVDLLGEPNLADAALHLVGG